MVEKLSVQIALEGGAEVEKQLADIGAAGQKAFTDISKSAEKAGGLEAVTKSFAEVTKSIAALGSTGKEALEAAAAAAQKLGASANQLAGVESVIKALAARARDSGTAFSDLAANYDKARVSAASFVKVNENVGTSFAALASRLSVVGTVLSTIATAVTAAGKATFGFAEALNKASDEATRLGLTLEKFQRGKKFFEDLGISSASAADGMKQMGKAAEQAGLDNVRKAITELRDFGSRGFGVQGTAQLKLLNEAAKGFGERAELARAALVEFGQPLPQGAIKSLQQLKTELGSDEAGLAAFRRQLESMPPGLDRLNAAVDAFGQKAGTAFVQSIRAANGEMDAAELKAHNLEAALNQLNITADKFGSVALAPALTAGIDLMNTAAAKFNAELERSPWGVFLSAAQAALNPVGFLAGQATTAIIKFGSALGGIAWNAVASAATTAWNAIVTAVQAAGTAITTFVSSFAGITWDAISSAGVAAWNALTGAIQSAIDKLLQFIGLKPSTPATGGGAPGMAGGGLLGGRGSGTSDSNLAWVSRGEHIMPARAVAQPGVLALLEALRRSGGNLSRVLDGMGRFALGGMIRGPMPAMAFAGGGMVGGGHLGTLTLGLPSGGSVTVRASAGVADELRREAALAQVRSGGRKPSRYS